jgi:hypothetical protein
MDKTQFLILLTSTCLLFYIYLELKKRLEKKGHEVSKEIDKKIINIFEKMNKDVKKVEEACKIEENEIN